MSDEHTTGITPTPTVTGAPAPSTLTTTGSTGATPTPDVVPQLARLAQVPTVNPESLRRINDSLAAAAESLMPLSKAFRTFVEAITPPPVDEAELRERALWLRQHRNTGPRRRR